MINAGININYKYLLVSSCHNKNIDMLRLLINSGANINENLSIVSQAYYYLPSSQEKELDTIFLNAGVSRNVIREIKNGTHESIPKFILEIKFKKFDSKTNIDNSDDDIQAETLQQIEISPEQQKYNQSIIDIIESERKEQIVKIISSNFDEPIWNSVRSAISIFGVIPLDALEKSSGETKEFILKLMLIVKNYFGDIDLYYEKYINSNKDWFEYWENALVWFRRCQTFDKTLISNPEEPIKYPSIPSGKVLTKKLTPPRNTENK